jgi:glycosyltransferase involved in cell wall biosynthesis
MPRQQNEHRMLISFVIPAKDEEETIGLVASGIETVMKAEGHRWELIFVDDGSEDNTWQRMTELAERSSDDPIRALRLRRNFGKATALEVAFRECRGDIVFTMDADLQDDPEQIPRFLEKLAEGYDVVSCWKVNRRDPVSKTFPSKIFNAMTAALSGLGLHDFNCGFKAYRREVLDKIRLYGELHRYIPVLAHDLGYRVGEVPVTHHPRRHGASKYGFERYARGLLDLLTIHATTRYLQKPGHLFGGIGLVSGLLGGAILTYLMVIWFLGSQPIGTRPLFAVGILLIILSIQLISLGILAELLTRHTEARIPETLISQRTYDREAQRPNASERHQESGRSD